MCRTDQTRHLSGSSCGEVAPQPLRVTRERQLRRRVVHCDNVTHSCSRGASTHEQRHRRRPSSVRAPPIRAHTPRPRYPHRFTNGVKRSAHEGMPAGNGSPGCRNQFALGSDKCRPGNAGNDLARRAVAQTIRTLERSCPESLPGATSGPAPAFHRPQGTPASHSSRFRTASDHRLSPGTRRSFGCRHRGTGRRNEQLNVIDLLTVGSADSLVAQGAANRPRVLRQRVAIRQH